MESNFSILAWETHEHNEKATKYDTGKWAPRLVGVQYATGEQWRNSSIKSEEAGLMWKYWSVVDMSGGKSKV